MSPEKQGKSREEGVANAAGKDEQPEPRNYLTLAVFLTLAAFVSLSANAGLTIALVTKTVGTHAQKHLYAVSLWPTVRADGVKTVAKVPCVEVSDAIVSIQNGDADQGLVMIPLGNGEFSTLTMSAAHYQVHEDSFGMEQISLNGDHDVLYNVSCETSMAACETNPGLLCDILSSAAASSSRRALAFEDAFDGGFRRLRQEQCSKQGANIERVCKDPELYGQLYGRTTSSDPWVRVVVAPAPPPPSPSPSPPPILAGRHEDSYGR